MISFDNLYPKKSLKLPFQNLDEARFNAAIYSAYVLFNQRETFFEASLRSSLRAFLMINDFNYLK